MARIFSPLDDIESDRRDIFIKFHRPPFRGVKRPVSSTKLRQNFPQRVEYFPCKRNARIYARADPKARAKIRNDSRFLNGIGCWLLSIENDRMKMNS